MSGFNDEAKGMLDLIHMGIKMLSEDMKEYMIEFSNMYRIIPEYLVDTVIKEGKIQYDYDIVFLPYHSFIVRNF